MFEIIVAIIGLLLTSITGYFYSSFLKSPKALGNTRFFTVALAIIALLVFILSIYLYKTEPQIFVVNVTTPTPENSTPQLTTRTPEGGTPTTPYPTPFPGSLTISPGLSVQQWNIEYVCQNGNALSVKILGVKISGEYLSYEVVFQQKSKPTKSVIVYPTDDIATFSEPILVDINSYVHVTIRPNMEGESLLWIDDLFFPLSPPGICK